MNKFKLGDRVTITENFGGAMTKGMVGVVAKEHMEYVGVDFGTKINNSRGHPVYGHNLGGAIKTATGWNVLVELVELLEEEPFEGNL